MNSKPNQISDGALRDSLAGGMSLPPPSRRKDCHASAVVFALTILAALLVVRGTTHLLYPFAIDAGEGTVLDAAWQGSRGQNIYGIAGDSPPYFFTIHNPVLPYLAALMVRIFGPAAWAARLVALACQAGAALLICLFVRRETASRAGGAIAALFFLVERHTYAGAGYLLPDWPAIFFSLLGLYLWLRGGKGRVWAIVSFALAFFSRQASMAAAAAAFVSLFLEGRRAEGIRLFGVFAALLAAGVGICALVFGKAYLVNTFFYASIAPPELHRSFGNVAAVLVIYFVPAAAWLFFARKAAVDRSALLPVTYFVFGLAAVFMSGGAGESSARFFDFAAGLSILAGLVWARVESKILAGKLSFAVVALIVLQMFLVAIGTTYRLSPLGDRARGDFLHDSAIKEAFQDVDGVILTRETGFGFDSRARPFCNDLYILNQLIESGRLSPEAILAPVRNREFAMVIMPEQEITRDFFSGDLRAEVHRNYGVTRRECGELFLVPLTESPSGNAQPFTP